MSLDEKAKEFAERYAIPCIDDTSPLISWPHTDEHALETLASMGFHVPEMKRFILPSIAVSHDKYRVNQVMNKIITFATPFKKTILSFEGNTPYTIDAAYADRCGDLSLSGALDAWLLDIYDEGDYMITVVSDVDAPAKSASNAEDDASKFFCGRVASDGKEHLFGTFLGGRDTLDHRMYANADPARYTTIQAQGHEREQQGDLIAPNLQEEIISTFRKKRGVFEMLYGSMYVKTKSNKTKQEESLHTPQIYVVNYAPLRE